PGVALRFTQACHPPWRPVDKSRCDGADCIKWQSLTSSTDLPPAAPRANNNSGGSAGALGADGARSGTRLRQRRGGAANPECDRHQTVFSGASPSPNGVFGALPPSICQLARALFTVEGAAGPSPNGVLRPPEET